MLNLGQGTQMFYMGSLMIALAVEESGTEKTANNMNKSSYFRVKL